MYRNSSISQNKGFIIETSYINNSFMFEIEEILNKTVMFLIIEIFLKFIKEKHLHYQVL